MNDLALHILLDVNGPLRLEEIIAMIDPADTVGENRLRAQLARMHKTGIISGEWLPGELAMAYSVVELAA